MLVSFDFEDVIFYYIFSIYIDMIFYFNVNLYYLFKSKSEIDIYANFYQVSLV